VLQPGSRQVEPTPQAARVRLHQPIGHIRQAKLGQDRFSASRGLPARAAKQPRHHVQVLPPGHGRLDGGVLPSQTYGLPNQSRTAADVNVGYPQGSGIWTGSAWRPYARTSSSRRRWAQYSRDLTAARHQIKPGQGLDLAETLDQPLSLEDAAVNISLSSAGRPERQRSLPGAGDLLPRGVQPVEQVRGSDPQDQCRGSCSV
jgi:hypothetical protein